MNRRAIARCLAAAACAVMAAGCANMTASPMSANQMAARDLALSVADPASGTTQEMTDLGAFLFASGAAKSLGGAPWSLSRAEDFALYLTEGFASGLFAWNASANDYEMTQTRSVTAGPVSGSANVTIDVAFFTSSDASGIGVQIPGPSAGLPSTIHSLSYRRELTGTFSNSLSGVRRQHTSTSSFTVTGLNSGSPGFTVNGSTTVTFTNSYPDHRTITGTLIETVSGLAVSASLQGDGTWLVGSAGTITVDYSATITRADGTVVQVQKTATVTLDGQKTARVDMDGADVDVDVMTGVED